jgi:hypothetical protein
VAPERPFGDCCFQVATKRRYSSSALPIVLRSLSLIAVGGGRALLLAAAARRMTGFELEFSEPPLKERRAVPGVVLVVREQINRIEQTRLECLEKEPAEGSNAMVSLLAGVIGVGVETADLPGARGVITQPPRLETRTGKGYLLSWRVWVGCDCVKDRHQQPLHKSNQRLMLHPPAEIRVPLN